MDRQRRGVRDEKSSISLHGMAVWERIFPPNGTRKIRLFFVVTAKASIVARWEENATEITFIEMMPQSA